MLYVSSEKIYYTREFIISISSYNSLLESPLPRCAPAVPIVAPTLARKLDTVHIKTVNSSSVIPSVRLATPSSPSLARRPEPLALADLECDVPRASNCMLPDRDLRRDDDCVVYMSWSPSVASSAGARGSAGAIVSRLPGPTPVTAQR